MLDFDNLIVNRLIIHSIARKKSDQDHSSFTASNESTTIDDDALEIIKERLIDAAGKRSKAFELELEETGNGSFFNLAIKLNEATEEEFISYTTDIAELLAESQTNSNINGAFLLILDCLDTDTLLPIVIVIKAEPHKALKMSDDSSNQISVLKEVFLSPSQKLYKLGILFQKSENDSEEINDQYGCFLFDDQFRIDQNPAEYFHKTFLGFKTGNNSKIQSSRFFSKTQSFIQSNIKDPNQRDNLLITLKHQFTVTQSDLISPNQFANDYLPLYQGIRDLYISEVCSELPSSFVRDSSLLSHKLSNRKITFPSKVNLSGPEDQFDQAVSIVTSDEVLNSLDPESSSYTIIKISGQPFQK